MHEQNGHKKCIYTFLTLCPVNLTKNAQLSLKYRNAMAPFQLVRNRIAKTHFRHTGYWLDQDSQRNHTTDEFSTPSLLCCFIFR
jgi:hypothetical protein